jgi:hypothetical protein
MSDGLSRALWIILPALFFVEVLLQSRLVDHVLRLKKTLDKSLRAIRSKKGSDHWKEKALLAYARHMFILSMKVFLILGTAFGGVFLLIILQAVIFGQDGMSVLRGLSHWDMIISSALVAAIYIRLRAKLIGKPLRPT